MLSWVSIINEVLRRPPHEDITIPEGLLPDPEIVGFIKTIGEPQGEIAQYELTLHDGRRIHVRRFRGFYKVHWDYFSPLRDPINHLRYDAPHWWVLSITSLSSALGALIGHLIDKEKGAFYGLIAGHFAGLFISYITLPSMTIQLRHRLIKLIESSLTPSKVIFQDRS
jgi:hypothetical protein